MFLYHFDVHIFAISLTSSILEWIALEEMELEFVGPRQQKVFVLFSTIIVPILQMLQILEVIVSFKAVLFLFNHS